MTVDHAPLGELCTLVRGTYPTLKTEPGDYPLVVTAAFRRTASTYQLEGPAVCVPLISSTGHGDAALHRVHYQDGKFALANLLVALLPKDTNRCDAKYLYHLLTAKKDELFVPLMLGTANVSLKERDIAAVVVPLPPVAEQRRIVARVEAVAARIAEARRLREEAKGEADVLVRVARHRQFTRSAANHPTFPLGEVTETRLGKMLSSAVKLGIAPAPYLRNANIQNDYIDLSSVYEMDFFEDEKDEFRLEPGDILLNEGGYGVGRCAVWEGQISLCYFQKSLHRVRVNPKHILPRFLMHQLIWANDEGQFDDITKATTFQHLTGVRLKRHPVFIPPLPEQRRIVAHLVGLRAKVDAVRALQAETAAELDALLPAVLARAFAGRL